MQKNHGGEGVDQTTWWHLAEVDSVTSRLVNAASRCIFNPMRNPHELRATRADIKLLLMWFMMVHAINGTEKSQKWHMKNPLNRPNL